MQCMPVPADLAAKLLTLLVWGSTPPMGTLCRVSVMEARDASNVLEGDRNLYPVLSQ